MEGGRLKPRVNKQGAWHNVGPRKKYNKEAKVGGGLGGGERGFFGRGGRKGPLTG